jgi:hypothetical protein
MVSIVDFLRVDSELDHSSHLDVKPHELHATHLRVVLNRGPVREIRV